MSSATAWTGNMITLLFVSLTANCSNSCGSSCKIPVPETAGCSVDSQRPRVSGTQLSCASVGDQLAIIGKVSRGMTGQEVHFIDNIWGLYRPWPPSPERSIGPIAYRRGWCNPCWLRDSAASVRRSALQSARPRPVEWLQWRYEHQAPLQRPATGERCQPGLRHRRSAEETTEGCRLRSHPPFDRTAPDNTTSMSYSP